LYSNNYDLMYGYGGKLVYFDRVDSVKFKSQWNESVQNLLALTLTDSKELVWWKAVEKDYVNLGLAHGMPSILLLLLRAYKLNTKSDTGAFLEQTINKAVNYILAHQLSQASSLYPALIIQGEPMIASRLAWCYGDLSIAFTLVVLGKQLNNQYYLDQGLKAALLCASRNLDDSGVHWIESQEAFDVGWCHGTSGIAHLFHQLSLLVPETPQFNIAYEYWLELTVDNLEKKLKSYTSGVEPRKEATDGYSWIPDLSLLDGIAGTGLVLIASQDAHLSSWNSLFLPFASKA
jgi:hypothetical protein